MKIIVTVLSVFFLISVGLFFSFGHHSMKLTPIEKSTKQMPEISLSASGLGAVKFGASQELALAILTPMLGGPSKDTGWIDSFSAYGTCPGSQIRVVEWGMLRVFFGDSKYGAQKLFRFEYTKSETANPELALTTDIGLTLGMDNLSLLSLYPQARIADTPWGFEQVFIDEEQGHLGSTIIDNKISRISGGMQCGE